MTIIGMFSSQKSPNEFIMLILLIKKYAAIDYANNSNKLFS